ncbi:MAG: hydroxyacid dehydrogenase [Candidatus Komeilibacteria bacterium CG_4_9_14_0_8_um_filter_36_9]|uniref:Hydroxyacid dehydrogenase n=1 Tax=Candidatus Komeilibacteria bacterium CG_4_9_14_0_8_um_filter_36_9 TaxID=1974473 RepID=A0A2M8DRE6_9BACT|nr:MAG: hydroxyacid dehydrogenase [Candidatus Komeilibacteria bacterium CG_4_9_14_0_8_um_filter_36_9]
MNTNNITFLEVEKEDESIVQENFPQAKIITKSLSENEIIIECQNAQIICIFIYTKITARVIKNLPNLKFIATRSVGYDHIDLKTAQEKNIKICNVPDYGSHVIAEHVFALLLSGIRKIGEGNDQVEKKHDFSFQGLRGVALKGKMFGVIGTGKIGKNVARIASLGFLMDVIAYDPFPDKDAARENHFVYSDLENIYSKADIISLHCPLNKETEHLINEDAIYKMRKGVVLVNTSRGGVVDTKALIQGLKSKKISHALLDVLEHEKNIKENKELTEIPGVIITPHIAFYADDSMKRMYEEAFASINSFIKGEKLIHQVIGI